MKDPQNRSILCIKWWTWPLLFLSKIKMVNLFL
ncbi:unknown protein [Simkania negevensis Z]|uniref:Uncharacterized protein n=1 Tax=Simkania negevensis (strain ATCC VR-1471 / DSM 27360 / Z) TaxID=331113 RepID=F8L6X7_SIMNZ|nr:unknown protein [Simkania negevensis Z]